LKKAAGIKTKLILNVVGMISAIFLMVLTVITFMNFSSVNKNISKSERTIRQSIITRGKNLVINNSIAMHGMAEDNDFRCAEEHDARVHEYRR
jgi:hypothetical protein